MLVGVEDRSRRVRGVADPLRWRWDLCAGRFNQCEKWQISQKGGVQPRWSSDGNELFFLDPDGQLMAVSIREGDPRRAGVPKQLFTTGLAPSNALDQFGPWWVIASC